MINEGLPNLEKKAVKLFNAFIRNRDNGKPCISCSHFRVLEAGHYYSAGHHKILKYDEDNVHGQCKQCNRHKHGNLIYYRKGLIKRIGEKRLLILDAKIEQQKGRAYKRNRFEVEQIINKYKKKAS